MSVSRSALASSAARSASAASAPIRVGDPARRCGARAGRDRPGCRACRGRRPCRAPGTRDSSVRFRSWSKKNLASARRGRTTRSLPSTMRAGSAGAMLLTTRKRLVSAPSGVEQREVLLVRLHRQDQALRRHGEELGARSGRSSTFGRSTSAVTSSSSASSSIGARPAAAAAASQLAHDLGAALGEAGDRRRLRRAAASRSSRASRSTIGARLPSKRWPCVVRPASRPSARTGTTSSPCSATRPCAGRTKLTLVQPSASWYCMTFGIGSCASARSSARCRPSASDAPAATASRKSVSLLPSTRRCRRRHDRRVGAERGELLEQRRRRPRRRPSRPTLAGISLCETGAIGGARRAPRRSARRAGAASRTA